MFEEFFTEYGVPVFGGALFFVAAWIIAIFLDRLARKVLTDRANLDISIATTLARALRVSICVLAALAVLEEVGVEVASLIAALGIFGFALAIGLRTTTNNFFTGVMLFVLKPYEVGDYIEGERVEGVVESMGMFHTVVITDDGTYAAVPNGAMWMRSVRNFSRVRPRKITVEILLDPSSQFEKCAGVIEQVLAKSEMRTRQIPPLVRVRDVTKSSLIIGVQFWCEAQDIRTAYEEVSGQLRAALAAEGLVVKSVRQPRKKSSANTRKSTPAPASDDVI